MAGPPEVDQDSELHDALFASKVDAFAAEYNHLLVSFTPNCRLLVEILPEVLL